MLKFLCICVTVALGVMVAQVLSSPMELPTTTIRPEATTEDTTGRLLALPDPVKCENRKINKLKLVKRYKMCWLGFWDKMTDSGI